MDRRNLLKVVSLAAPASLVSYQVRAETPEKTSIALGVGGKPVFYYLPLTIAERLGFFEQEGLQVTVNDFAGGSKALQAMLGGSVDVVTGSYEHTINMQAKGQDIRGLVELARNATVLVVRKSKADAIRSVAELKGAKIGVSAPGSSTNFFALYLLAKAGLKAADVSFVGVGASAGAVAAIQTGELDAMSNVDPVISKLELDGAVSILADARSEAGSRELFGALPPASVLYAPKDFIDRYPVTTQRLVNAFMRALKWIEQNPPEKIAETVPEEYWLGDKALYLKALKANLSIYSRTGVPPIEGMKASLDMLGTFDPNLNSGSIDLSKTFAPDFAKKFMG